MSSSLAIAALVSELPQAATAPARFKVLPAGQFSAVDGRPANMEDVSAKHWLLTPSAAQAVITIFQTNGLDLPIDFEHQSLATKENGKPAPAMGWITGLEFVPNDGLYANVAWTATGRAYVEAREYRYLSPVFAFDRVSGEVIRLLHVALVNTPALNSLPPLAVLKSFFATKGTNQMEIAPITSALKLTATATQADVLAAIAALQTAATAKDQELAALKTNQFDASKHVAKADLDALSSQVATLKSSQFDPAKHIPLSEHSNVVNELATLKAAQTKAEHAALMQAALSDGRILPANQAYWDKQPLAALQEFLKTAPAIAALKGTQTGGAAPAGQATAALSEADLEACRLTGVDPQKFAATKASASSAASV